MKKNSKPQLLLTALSIALYLTAYFMPVFITSEKTFLGFECLVLGGLTALSLLYQPMWLVAWSANLFYIAGVFLSLKSGMGRKGVIAVSSIALILSLSSLTIESVLPDSSRMDVPDSFGSGIYLWTVAIALQLVAGVVKEQV